MRRAPVIKAIGNTIIFTGEILQLDDDGTILAPLWSTERPDWIAQEKAAGIL